MSNTKTSRSRRKVPGPILEYQDGIPVVPMVAKRYHKNTTLLKLIACPYCGDQHVHGGGDSDDDPRNHEGHRVAHCLEPDDRGYILRVVCIEPATEIVDRLLKITMPTSVRTLPTSRDDGAVNGN